MMLDLARSVLPGHGRLWLAGANRSGIRSSEKHLRERFRNTPSEQSRSGTTLCSRRRVLRTDLADA